MPKMNTELYEYKVKYDRESLKGPSCGICENNIRTVSDCPTLIGYKCFKCCEVYCVYCSIRVPFTIDELSKEENELLYNQHINGDTLYKMFCLSCYTLEFDCQH